MSGSVLVLQPHTFKLSIVTWDEPTTGDLCVFTLVMAGTLRALLLALCRGLGSLILYMSANVVFASQPTEFLKVQL